MTQDMDVRALRREAARQKREKFLTRGTLYALLAEAFFIGLSPALATAALLVGAVLLFFRFRLVEEFRFRRLPLDVPAALFALLGAASILVSPDRFFSFYNYYNLVGVYVLTYLLAGQVLRSREEVRLVLLALLASAALVIVYGFYQFLFGIDTASMRWVDGEAFPELKKRVFSTWENPNILAGYLDVLFAVLLGLFAYATRRAKIFLGIFMALALLCLTMTYARGALLVLALVVCFYGLFKDRRLLAVFIVLGAALLFLDPVLMDRLASVFTKVDTSTELRFALWEATLAMIADHPFLGIGWGAYYLVYPEYDFYMQGNYILIVHAHNLFLNYAAEIGLPGLFSFLWFFFGSLFLAARTRFWDKAAEASPFDLADEGAEGELQLVEESIAAKRAARKSFVSEVFPHAGRLYSGLSLGLALAFLSIALNGITDDLLFNIPSSMLLWLMAALTGALVLLREAEDDTEKEALHEEK